MQIPASSKMDFHGMLVTYLRDKGYSAHIVEFEGRDELGRWLDHRQCVEVGFPRPALQFWSEDVECSYRIKKKSGSESPIDDYEWNRIGSIFDPNLLDEILLILDDDSWTFH